MSLRKGGFTVSKRLLRRSTKVAGYVSVGLIGVSVWLTSAGTSAAAELTPLPAASANQYRCVEQPNSAVPVPPLLPGAAVERAAAGNPPPAL